MSDHPQPSQDQDLRTALEGERDRCLREEKQCRASEYYRDAEAWRAKANAAQAALAALTPAQAPHKAGEREGLAELIAATTDLLNSSLEHPLGNEYAEHPDDNDKRRGDSLGKDIYRARWNLRDRARKALAALTPQPNGTEASRGVGAEMLREAAAAYFAAFDAEPEKDCWDTETGEEEPGAQKFSSDWAHNDHMDAILAARETLRQALAANPTPPLSPPLSPDSTDDPDTQNPLFWARQYADEFAKRMMAEAEVSSLKAAALTPSAPIAGPVRDIEALCNSVLGNCYLGKEPEAELAEKIKAALASPVRDDGAQEALRAVAVDALEILPLVAERLAEHEGDNDEVLDDLIDRVRQASLPAPTGDVPGEAQTFQARALTLFEGAIGDDPSDLAERRDRFGEEALELQQALGQSREDAHALVDYVFGRPVGEPAQEFGGTLATLAVLASYAGEDLMRCAEADIARWADPAFITRLRMKRAGRHGRGPLPGATPGEAQTQEGGR